MKITIETRDGALERDYNESEVKDWGYIVEEMLDTIEKSKEVTF